MKRKADKFYHNVWVELDTTETDQTNIPIITTHNKKFKIMFEPKVCEFWVSSDVDLRKPNYNDVEEAINYHLPKIGFDYYVASMDLTKTKEPGETILEDFEENAIPVKLIEEE